MTTGHLSTTLDDVLGRLTDGDLAVVRDGPDTIIGIEPVDVRMADAERALDVLDGLDSGWWAGFLSYDLGRAVERVPDIASASPFLPDLALSRYDARLRLSADGRVRVEGRGPARAKLESFLDTPIRASRPQTLRTWRSSFDRTTWDDAVRRILAHLRAGDCYQVNLTRRLECDEAADPIELHRSLTRANPAPQEALIRIGDVAVVSASPECFLRRDGRHIMTRPIKGTSRSAEALASSAKDRAENVMIVDLSRNDLGRVCQYGSVHVPELFCIEHNPGHYNLVSTIAGTLRGDVSVGDLIRATFPPASITGCPKPRVLEIIETLEPVRRGLYCGAVGFIDADRDVVDLNVAIRTFTITAGKTFFGVGGGIIGDSDPAAEWDETELKADRLLAIAAGEA